MSYLEIYIFHWIVVSNEATISLDDVLAVKSQRSISGPLLFLTYIEDLSEGPSPKVQLLIDSCLQCVTEIPSS